MNQSLINWQQGFSAGGRDWEVLLDYVTGLRAVISVERRDRMITYGIKVPDIRMISKHGMSERECSRVRVRDWWWSF